MYIGKVLLHLYKLYIKDEGGIRRDIADTTRAVCKVVRDVKAIFATFFHQLQAFCPAFDNLIKGELRRLSALIA